MGEVERILSSGALPDTVSDARGAQRRRHMTTLELELMSVVLARPRPAGEQAATVASGGTWAGGLGPDSAYREELADELRRMGMRVEWRPDGALQAMICGAASATDQCLQAARAALELQERWPEAQIALATGAGETYLRLPAGEVIERAAGLWNGSEGDVGIVLDDISAGLLENQFILTAGRGGQRLLLASNADLTMDDGASGRNRPTCLGRDAELSMLEAVLTGVHDESKAAALLVKGPQGIGKTRLRRELLRRLRDHGHDIAIWTGQLDALSAGAPYGLLSSALFRLCRISPSEAIDDQRAKLLGRLGRNVPATERTRIAEFIGELCGVPFEDTGSPRLRAARSDPRLMSHETCGAFFDLLRGECAGRSVLLVLDDLQWGDAQSVDLIGAALRELSDQPFAVLALGRPEVATLFPRLWSDRVQEIALGGLGRKASERLTLELLRGSPASAPPAAVVARILAQAGGNPLFIEELVRPLRHALPQPGGPDKDGTDTAVPGTILAMLQARLGGLERGARRVLRAASIFGEHFWMRGLQTLLGESETDEIETWLRLMREAEIIERCPTSRLVGDSEYMFRHALLRAAAYSLLTDDDRRVGHELAQEFLAQAQVAGGAPKA